MATKQRIDKASRSARRKMNPKWEVVFLEDGIYKTVEDKIITEQEYKQLTETKNTILVQYVDMAELEGIRHATI